MLRDRKLLCEPTCLRSSAVFVYICDYEQANMAMSREQKVAAVEAYLDCFVSKNASQVRPAEDVTFEAWIFICRFACLRPSSGGLASARESLCRGLGSRCFTEWFHRNALVTNFQHGQVFCTSRRLENYTIASGRLHQRTPQR
jgi:hypothetical protein